MRNKGLLFSFLGVWVSLWYFQASESGMPQAQGPVTQHGFGYSVTTDTETQWKVYQLSYQDPNNAQNKVIARIVPEGGSNLISLEVNGVTILHSPPKISQAAGVGFGIPILYPTPNRVRNSRFTFDGRMFEFTPNERTNFIHGLVHRASWKSETPVVGQHGVSLKTYLDFDKSFSGFPLFPIRNRISMTFSLTPDGVLMGFEVANRSNQRLPFGFGLHPYFKISGERAQTFIRVPAQRHMEAEGLLPTGKLDPLDHGPFDIREFASLQNLGLDDVFWGMVPERPAEFEFRDKGIRVSLEASDLFTHAVVYTPKERPYFCIENQTCSTDAHNLYSKGFERESHLLILNPGQSTSGTVRIRVRGR